MSSEETRKNPKRNRRIIGQEQLAQIFEEFTTSVEEGTDESLRGAITMVGDLRRSIGEIESWTEGDTSEGETRPKRGGISIGTGRRTSGKEPVSTKSGPSRKEKVSKAVITLKSFTGKKEKELATPKLELVSKGIDFEKAIKGQAKGLLKLSWPSHPTWFKSRGDFGKKIKAPFESAVKKIQKLSITATPITEENVPEIGELKKNFLIQLNEYQDHLKELGNPVPPKDKEKADFLLEKIETILRLEKELGNFVSLANEHAYVAKNASLLWMSEGGKLEALSMLGPDNDELSKEERAEALHEAGSFLMKLKDNDPKALGDVLRSRIDIGSLSEIIFDLFSKKETTGDVLRALFIEISKNLETQDPDYFNALIMSLIRKEAAAQNAKDSFFRGEPVPVLAMKDIGETAEFSLELAADTVKTLKKVKKDIEIDPLRIDDERKREKVMKESMDFLVDQLDKIFQKVISKYPPDKLCLYSYTLVDAFETKFPSATQAEKLVKAGGVIFLRYINPAIAGAFSVQVEEVTSKGNRRMITEVPDKFKKGHRAAILLTKVLQNLSNNLEFSPIKEEYMVPFNAWVRRNMPVMEEYLNRVIARGKELFESGPIGKEGSDAFAPLLDYSDWAEPEVEEFNLGEAGVFTIGQASGLGLNCLIDSVGQGLNINSTPEQRDTIRDNLIELGYAEPDQFLWNDQVVLDAILQGFNVHPAHYNIFFQDSNGGPLDDFTYNMGANPAHTLYVYNERNVHFRPMTRN